MHPNPFVPRARSILDGDAGAMHGGVPRYYVLLQSHGLFGRPVQDVLDLFFRMEGPLREEGRLLVGESFDRDYQTYFSILQAIASGHTTLTQMGGGLSMPLNRLSKYLDQLVRQHGFAIRRVPLLARPDAKQGHYAISDPLLRFWFRYVFRYAAGWRSEIASA